MLLWNKQNAFIACSLTSWNSEKKVCSSNKQAGETLALNALCNCVTTPILNNLSPRLEKRKKRSGPQVCFLLILMVEGERKTIHINNSSVAEYESDVRTELCLYKKERHIIDSKWIRIITLHFPQIICTMFF